MLPHLPGANGTVAGSPVQVPPPPRMRLPELITSAGWSSCEMAFERSDQTVAQKAGLRYERKILQRLLDVFDGDLHIAPPLYWKDENGIGLAYPDALAIRATCIFCIEIKSQHMSEAWWQLRRKYEPILRVIYPKSKIVLLEICSSLDPTTPFPEVYTHVEDIIVFRETAKDGELGVFQWKE